MDKMVSWRPPAKIREAMIEAAWKRRTSANKLLNEVAREWLEKNDEIPKAHGDKEVT